MMVLDSARKQEFVTPKMMSKVEAEMWRTAKKICFCFNKTKKDEDSEDEDEGSFDEREPEEDEEVDSSDDDFDSSDSEFDDDSRTSSVSGTSKGPRKSKATSVAAPKRKSSAKSKRSSSRASRQSSSGKR